MTKKLLIANWKSNKTYKEANIFFDVIRERISRLDVFDTELVVAPPFTLLSECKKMIDKYNLPIKLSAQNISAFPRGAYTGEINAQQIKEFAEIVIIGHSERRKYLHETESDIENKVREANLAGLTVVQCVQDEMGIIHKNVELVAYEPPSAIGSGNPDTPEHISKVFEKLIGENSNVRLLYGGSVNPETFRQFLSIKNLSGFLIGSAGLEADSFLSLLK